jgi:PAS domain S-box-containing protein
VNSLPESKESNPAIVENKPTELELDLFFDYSLDLLLVVGFDNRFKQVSPSFERILGWTKQEVISKSFYDFLNPDDIEKTQAVFRAHETGKNAVLFVNRYRCKDGSYRWISWNSHPLTEKQMIVGIGRDITDSKKAEENLIEYMTKLHLALEASKSGTWEWNLETGENSWSEETWLLYGLKPNSRKASYELWLETIDPEDRERAAQTVNEAAKNKSELYVEYRLSDSCGKGRWLMSRGQPQKNAQGVVDIYLGIIIDITERKKAEEALMKKQDELQTIIDSSKGLIFYTDLTNHFIRVNKAFAEIMGLPKEQLEGRSLFEIYPKEEAEAFWSDDKQVIATGKDKVGIEEKMQSQQGQRWVQTDKSPYRDAKGNIIGVIGFSLDITERKKAEETLNKLNEELEERVLKRTEEVSAERQRLYNVLETLPAYVILLDKDYCVPFANKVFRECFGESHGRRCYDFLFKRESPCENCETYKVLKTNGPHHWEWTGPDGRDYDIYDFPFVEADGSTLILEMGIDITERKRVEKQIRDVSSYSRSLIEASLDPLVTISAEGKITDVNQATELATGCSREELIGRDFSDYFTEPEKAKIGYKQVFSEGFVRDYPLAIKHKSGKITDVLYNATIYTNEAGELQGVFAAARDITELKKAEEQAQEAAKKLKDAERLAAIGATAGMVGHDIRNPLQAITGDVFLAKTDLIAIPDSEEKKCIQESLSEIEKNVDYINKIVADLQDFARPLKPNAEETDIKLIIDELLKKNGLPENVKVKVKVEPDARKIVADSSFINRIMYNLVTNAVQAMPKGGKLTIHAYKEAKDILITVKDTGVGIPKKVKEKLFTPMFTTKSKGQGFGLAVIKRMTDSLGGTVSFESEEGKGTTFIIRLPPPKDLNGKLTFK